MRKVFLFLSVCLSLAAWAEEAGDTTVIYKDRKIVVDVDSTDTRLTVYDVSGRQMTKIKESTFIDGQEIERVYVGSPFIPHKNLQTMFFRPSFPTVWFGLGNLTKHVMSSESKATNSRRSGSFEIGVTPYNIAIPFDKARMFGLTAAAQIMFARYNYHNDNAMCMNGDMVDFINVPSGNTNYMYYGAIRIPVMFGMQMPDVYSSCAIGLSFEMRTNAKYKFKAGEAVPGIPGSLQLNRYGVNLDVSIGISALTFGASFGLTPLYKAADGTKAYTCSAQIGVNIWQIFGKKK